MTDGGEAPCEKKSFCQRKSSPERGAKTDAPTRPHRQALQTTMGQHDWDDLILNVSKEDTTKLVQEGIDNKSVVFFFHASTGRC